MKNSKYWIIILAAVALLGLLAFCRMNRPAGEASKKQYDAVQLVTGSIRVSVSTTGDVQPQNRLSVKAPISGRIDQILVQEGEVVIRGQILAYLSSTDRATLIDAAQSEGEPSRKYWESVYKNTPIIAPLAGTVIVRSLEPGQTVAQNEVILVLSDHLIVNAQVDETDIGKVKLGQVTDLSLDAYPDIHVAGVVNHIAYESKVVNNVTTYDVDIMPKTVPSVFRSGMSANVEIIVAQKENILLLPREAVKEKRGKIFVLLKANQGSKPERREIETGLSNDTQIEIIRGITAADEVLLEKVDETSLKKSTAQGSNPFMPQRKRPGR